MLTKRQPPIARRESTYLGLTGLFLFIFLLLTSALPGALADKTETSGFTLTILHTNDLHSHAESFQDRDKLIGGLARLGEAVATFRKETPNAVVIDCGDIFQGTPLFTRYKGEVEVEILNKIGYDYYTIGNHEFDEGADNLARQLSKAKFKVLCSNLDFAAHPLGQIAMPTHVKKIDGQEIAFIGVITPDIESLAPKLGPIKLKGSNRNETWLLPIKAEIKKVKAQGINKIILVSHCGLENDKLMAQELTDVDAIIGGHSHTTLFNPLIIDHGQRGKTYIVQTGCYGRYLGKLNLRFDAKGRVETELSSGRLLAIRQKLPQNPELSAYIREKKAPLNYLSETVIASAKEAFDNNFRNLPGDSMLGNLICDSFLAAPYPANPPTIAFENRGGIRSHLDKGPITLEKVEELLPFDNHLVCATVDGATLKKALEHSIASGTGGKFLDVAGLRFIWDTQAPPGKRLLLALARQGSEYQTLQDQKSYRIVMTDYSFKGGEGYIFKTAKDIVYSAKRLNEPFKAYLKSLKTISAGENGRIIPVSSRLPRELVTNRFSGRLANSKYKRCNFYTGQSLGITKVKNKYIPLAQAQLLRENLSIEEARGQLQKLFLDSRKERLVLEVIGKKGNNSQAIFELSKPLNQAELANLLSCREVPAD
jgi:5'-nucleotidase